eukprot:m.56989 g.56989  ORF g.56989 m.56989 type:complete len:678 (-) comp11581_c0_seq1:1010-3043(-)
MAMASTGGSSQPPSRLRVGALVRKLVLKTCPNSPNVERLYNYSLRLLSSNLLPSLEDEHSVQDALQRAMVQRHGVKYAARVSDLCRQVHGQNVVNNRWQILYLLYTLRESQGELAVTQSLLPAPAPAPTPAERRVLATLLDPNSAQPCSATSPSVAQVSQAKATQRQITALKQRQATETDFSVGEEELLADVLLACQGLQGKYILYNPRHEAFTVSSEVGVTTPVRQLVEKLASLGWLFNEVRAYAEANHEFRLNQAFASALRDELAEYYRLMSLLQSQTQPDADSYKLTLRRLIVWTLEPLQRLKMLAMMVDTCKGLRGGRLLSKLYAFSHHGDEMVLSLVSSLIKRLLVPFFEVLHHWMYDGLLHDVHSEFFVAHNPDAQQPSQENAFDYWSNSFYLKRSMLPSFISPSLANMIITIGKTINFVRVFCDDSTDFMQPLARLDPLGSLSWHQDEGTSSELPGLAEAVQEAYAFSAQYLLRILFEKQQLRSHLFAARKYLLLGQGDFVIHLMDLLRDELEQPADQLLVHNITGVLDGALRETNAQYETPDVLQRLQVHVSLNFAGEKGWDVFTLDYAMSGPISALFSPSMKTAYRNSTRFTTELHMILNKCHSFIHVFIVVTSIYDLHQNTLAAHFLTINSLALLLFCLFLFVASFPLTWLFSSCSFSVFAVFPPFS